MGADLFWNRQVSPAPLRPHAHAHNFGLDGGDMFPACFWHRGWVWSMIADVVTCAGVASLAGKTGSL